MASFKLTWTHQVCTIIRKSPGFALVTFLLHHLTNFPHFPFLYPHPPFSFFSPCQHNTTRQSLTILFDLAEIWSDNRSIEVHKKLHDFEGHDLTYDTDWKAQLTWLKFHRSSIKYRVHTMDKMLQKEVHLTSKFQKRRYKLTQADIYENPVDRSKTKNIELNKMPEWHRLDCKLYCKRSLYGRHKWSGNGSRLPAIGNMHLE